MFLIMVLASGNFTTAIAKGNHKAGEIQGLTRWHPRMISLPGVKQSCIGVDETDCDTADYKSARYDEVADEVNSMSLSSFTNSGVHACLSAWWMALMHR